MQLSLVSWNGSTDINNGVDFSAFFEGGQDIASRDARYIQRVNKWKRLAGADYRDPVFVLKILCLGTIHSQRETIKKYFTLEDENVYGTLIAKDTADSDRLWYVTGLPLRVVEESVGLMSITLALDEPHWRTVAESANTLSVTESPSSTDLEVIGNLDAQPEIHITPTLAKGGDYSYKRWVAVYNRQTRPYVNYPLDFGGIDTAALISASKMQSDGRDFRLWIDGAETDRWFGATTDARGIGSSDTAVWGVINLSAPLSFKLGEAIDSTSTPAYIQGAENVTTRAIVGKLKTASNKIVTIDGEPFSYTDGVGARLTGVERALKGVAAGSHAPGATVRHVEHDIWLLYGSSDASTPTIDETRKPIIETNSTNTSWIYANFYDSVYPRPGAWLPTRVLTGAGRGADYYTQTQNSNANPAAVMGAYIPARYYYGTWRADNGDIQWSLNNPSGIVSVSADGYKYRYTTGYPVTAALQYLNVINRWTTLDNQASPTSDNSWTAFSIASTDTGALPAESPSIRFQFYGVCPGYTNNYSAYEITDATIALSSTGIPEVVVGGEQSTYRLQCRITNNTTGEWLEINADVGLNRTITVDCKNKTVKLDDGTNLHSALTLSSNRSEWLNLPVGTNSITYTESGAVGVTVEFEWENRNTM